MIFPRGQMELEKPRNSSNRILNCFKHSVFTLIPTHGKAVNNYSLITDWFFPSLTDRCLFLDVGFKMDKVRPHFQVFMSLRLQIIVRGQWHVLSTQSVAGLVHPTEGGRRKKKKVTIYSAVLRLGVKIVTDLKMSLSGNKCRREWGR